jgi:formamidopyrimidine-DNA glycosylase
MMGLQQLIESTNENYSLGLSPEDMKAIRAKMVFAGFDAKQVENIGNAVTVICSLAGSRSNAVSSYHSLKENQTALASTATAYNGSTCPRCGGSMRDVALSNKRGVNYCPGCKIAMPLKQ